MVRTNYLSSLESKSSFSTPLYAAFLNSRQCVIRSNGSIDSAVKAAGVSRQDSAARLSLTTKATSSNIVLDIDPQPRTAIGDKLESSTMHGIATVTDKIGALQSRIAESSSIAPTGDPLIDTGDHFFARTASRLGHGTTPDAVVEGEFVGCCLAELDCAATIGRDGSVLAVNLARSDGG